MGSSIDGHESRNFSIIKVIPKVKKIIVNTHIFEKEIKNPKEINKYKEP